MRPSGKGTTRDIGILEKTEEKDLVPDELQNTPFFATLICASRLSDLWFTMEPKSLGPLANLERGSQVHHDCERQQYAINKEFINLSP